MRLLLLVFLTSILAAVAEYFLPWWSVAIVAFLVAYLSKLRPGRAFAMGFTGIASCWLVANLIADIANHHILSNRMAGLFHLPGGALFIAVSVVLGGLVGGLAAWAASVLRGRPRPEMIIQS